MTAAKHAVSDWAVPIGKFSSICNRAVSLYPQKVTLLLRAHVLILALGGWSWKAATVGVARRVDKRRMNLVWNAALAAIGAATVSAASVALLELSSGGMLA